MRFRMLRPAAALAAVLTAVLLLAGCVPSDPIITPEPVPDATPVFASDEEALAAATDAYAKYLAVVDEVFSNGGSDLQALSGVLIGHQLNVETDGFKSAQQKGLHSVGSTTFDHVSLQRFDTTVSDSSTVVIYVCEDISGVDVLDRAGKSVVAEGLSKRSKYEVTFDLRSGVPSLLVANKELWGASKC